MSDVPAGEDPSPSAPNSAPDAMKWRGGPVGPIRLGARIFLARSLADSHNNAQKFHHVPGSWEHTIPLRGVRTATLLGVGGNEMTFVEAAFFLPGVLCAISVLWLLAYVPRRIRAGQMNEVRGLADLDELGWKGWTLVLGWAPWTCWRGCAGLHRDDWWRAYLSQTCWRGCKDLHRDDWWRAYLDGADK
jgi:hypothetical protein